MTYRTRLQHDLVRWESAGWVTPAGAVAIRAEVARTRHWLAPTRLLGFAGAVLLCFGAMLFVASNWQELSKLARLALLIGGMLAAYGLAAVLFRRALDAWGHAAILVAQGVFGAAIMLIAQMYHMDGHPPDAVLMWAAGAAAAGVALRSNPSLVLAVLLLGLWTAWESSLAPGEVHWAFVPAAAALGCGIAWATGWRPALHLLALVASLFVIGNGLRPPWRAHHVDVLAVGALVAALGVALSQWPGRVREIARPATAYGFAVAYAGAWLMHYNGTPQLGIPLVVWVALVLAAVVAAVILAWRGESTGLVVVAFAAFAAEVLSLYFETLGSLLSTSLFFLTAGVLMVALAAGAWLLLNRQPRLSEVLS